MRSAWIISITFGKAFLTLNREVARREAGDGVPVNSGGTMVELPVERAPLAGKEHCLLAALTAALLTMGSVVGWSPPILLQTAEIR